MSTCVFIDACVIFQRWNKISPCLTHFGRSHKQQISIAGVNQPILPLRTYQKTRFTFRAKRHLFVNMRNFFVAGKLLTAMLPVTSFDIRYTERLRLVYKNKNISSKHDREFYEPV